MELPHVGVVEEHAESYLQTGQVLYLSLLTEKLDVDMERLKITGVGYSFLDFYTYDQTPDGKLDEQIAPVNRTVKLLDLSSDTAKSILAME